MLGRRTAMEALSARRGIAGRVRCPGQRRDPRP